MNSGIIIGRVKGVALKETSMNTRFCELLIEENHDGRVADKIFRIVFWGNSVDAVSELSEGELVTVRFRLNANNFERDDGTVSYRAELTGEKFERIQE